MEMRDKYLKYKKKYLKIKNQMKGGASLIPLTPSPVIGDYYDKPQYVTKISDIPSRPSRKLSLSDESQLTMKSVSETTPLSKKTSTSFIEESPLLKKTALFTKEIYNKSDKKFDISQIPPRGIRQKNIDQPSSLYENSFIEKNKTSKKSFDISQIPPRGIRNLSHLSTQTDIIKKSDNESYSNVTNTMTQKSNTNVDNDIQDILAILTDKTDDEKYKNDKKESKIISDNELDSDIAIRQILDSLNKEDNDIIDEEDIDISDDDDKNSLMSFEILSDEEETIKPDNMDVYIIFSNGDGILLKVNKHTLIYNVKLELIAKKIYFADYNIMVNDYEKLKLYFENEELLDNENIDKIMSNENLHWFITAKYLPLDNSLRLWSKTPQLELKRNKNINSNLFGGK
jgi:hypothetical protein